MTEPRSLIADRRGEIVRAALRAYHWTRHPAFAALEELEQDAKNGEAYLSEINGAHDLLRAEAGDELDDLDDRIRLLIQRAETAEREVERLCAALDTIAHPDEHEFPIVNWQAQVAREALGFDPSKRLPEDLPR